MIIAVDFDGTVVAHEYPRLGRDVGAVPVLRRIVAKGHKLILWTMRSGDPLKQAASWFDRHDIPLFGINQNPEQHTWSASPKAYAHLYIDDAALGCPLIQVPDGRPYVDWAAVSELLEARGVL
jgi:hypothetical protein